MPTPLDRSDEWLVMAIRQGDLAAMETLIERYQHLIFMESFYVVRDAEQARDMTQEAFIRVFNALPRLKDPRKFRGWLRRIVRHCCLNVLRADRRTNTALRTWKEREDKSSGYTPDASYDETDHPLMDDLLAHLSIENARIVVMHYVEDLPLGSIARKLGLSPQAVKQRLYRARRHIQEEVLNMMKDTMRKNQLPAGFPGRVIAGLLEQGREAMLYMRHEEAHVRFQEAVTAAPEDAAALLALGTAYDPIAGAQAEHLAVLDRAAEHAPESIAVCYELASAYRQCGRQEAYEKQIDLCLKRCENRLAADPHDMEALKYKAQILRFRQDYAGAEQLLRTAHETVPDDQEALHFLAFSIALQNRHDEAAALYEQNLSKNPHTFWAFGALRQLATDLAFRRNEGSKAVAYMEQAWALTQHPREASNLISFYSITEQRDQAIDLYETVPIPRPHPRSLMTVARGYFARGEYEKARMALGTAIETTTDPALQAEAAIHLAAVRAKSGQKKAARQALDIGLGLDPHHRSSLLTGAPQSAFWHSWTRWLVECLEQVRSLDNRVEAMLRAVT